ncbi:MAG: TetR/AcrR family transcriptional regulator [Actinobacteria bacterium]|nr:TetR/AcrR family transcriptional regulator [Actinomycetota bacterium]
MEEERREKILDAAESMALKEGYRQFNLDRLSRRLRMSKNTIYSCFSSKEELFFAALNRRASRIIQQLKEITTMKVSAEEKLYLAGECIVRETSEMDSRLMQDLYDIFPEFFDLSQDFFRTVVNYIGKILEEGAKRKEFRINVNPILLTRIIRDIGNYLIEQDFIRDSDLSVEKIFSETMGILMNGILERNKAGGAGGDRRFPKQKASS